MPKPENIYGCTISESIGGRYILKPYTDIYSEPEQALWIAQLIAEAGFRVALQGPDFIIIEPWERLPSTATSPQRVLVHKRGDPLPEWLTDSSAGPQFDLVKAGVKEADAIRYEMGDKEIRLYVN